MLDIKFIRQNPDPIRKAAADKRIACDLDRLLEVDAERIALQQQLEALATRSREGGEQLALYRNPKSDWHRRAVEGGMPKEEIAAKAQEIQEDLNRCKAERKELEEREKPIREEFDRLMLLVPQPAAEGVPVGRDDTENVEIRKWGTIRQFDFEPKDHVRLGTDLDIVDLERGVRLAGTRNYVLKGDGALLHQAVLRLAQDMMVQRGFCPMTVPVLVREEVMYGTGYFPVGRDQAYLCERDGKSLVGTAEVPLTAYRADEIMAADELPLKMVATSTCFRREAGAAGKDTVGLYRIHFFDKVEQVIICRNDEAASLEHHQEILTNAEALMQALELPYRVVNVCTGDLGQGQVQKFDIETWMPSRDSYGETHSASRFHEFQARRLKLRYRDADRKVRYCHTLNNTVIASPRILIPLLELNQNADGSVMIPSALRPYMGGREKIEKQT
ncbi:MAG: serine--tRNA ligase [Planctomycetes bacterium]|nr:serine--tRNA ligase [Planctomycetota bacterium]